MANVALILILSLFSVTALSQSTAGTEIANIQSWLNHEGQKFYKPGTGDQWVRNSSPNGDRYIKVESPVNYKATNGRNYPLVIEKTGGIDASKVGKSVVKFARFAGPIGMGIQMAELVCELSDICKSDTNENEWIKHTTDHYEIDTSANCSNTQQGIAYFYRDTTWNVIREYKRTPHYYCDGPTGPHDGFGVVSECTPTAPCTYNDRIWTRVVSNMPSAGEPQPVAETDWEAAETQLNDPRFDEPLLANGQPVPLANLPIFGNQDPIPLSDTETVNRDSNGNVTGTTRTTTTLHLTDTATETRPGSVTGTEVTTKTESDLNGQPTGTQTSASSPPPPEAPTEVTVDFQFDSVPEHDLEEQDVDFDFDYESWGDGVCPPPIQIQTSFNTFTVPTEPICDFAEGARPIILMLAGLTAMFIIAGIRNAS